MSVRLRHALKADGLKAGATGTIRVWVGKIN